MLATVLQLVGGAFLLYQFYTIAVFLYNTFFLKVDVSIYKSGSRRGGAWAMVTGSTDGIGKGFAEELASRGFNIILVGRNEEKLKKVEEEIKAINKSISTQYIISDASTSAVGSTVASVAEAVSKLPVTILVNNVGVSTEIVGPVEGLTDKEIDDQILVNCLYSTKLTKYMIPILARQDRSLIINLSSLSSAIPAPYLSVYAATKMYNRHFSRSLSLECSARGIDSIAVTPGYVVSNMTKIKNTSTAVCSGRRCAKDTLDRVSLRDFSPYWHHAIAQFGASFVPTWFLDKKMLQIMMATRERQLKNQRKKE